MGKQPDSHAIPGFVTAIFSVVTQSTGGRSAGIIAGWSFWEGHGEDGTVSVTFRPTGIRELAEEAAA